MAPTVQNLKQEKFWFDKSKYTDAEKQYYEGKHGGNSKICSKAQLTPLAHEVDKARQRIIEMKEQLLESNDIQPSFSPEAVDLKQFKLFMDKVSDLEKLLQMVCKNVDSFSKRLNQLESRISNTKEVHSISQKDIKSQPSVSLDEDEEDDIDLFGEDSEEESEEAAKIREQRLAAYNEKKLKKPAVIAKSNIIFDVKPWDDETDMFKMEEEVRKITCDGLLWGAAKLVPLAYGIKKLQISCVVEDDKVSIDWLQETILEIEDYVQSVDIAAFNKI